VRGTVIRPDGRATHISEDGRMQETLFGPPGGDAVTFINRFTVHGSPEEFERRFADSCAFMAARAGYLGNTLLRHAQDPQAYVNIALWRDAQHFQRAVADPAFGPHRDALRALSASEPGLYRPVWSFDPATAGAGRDRR
jgi:deoxynogalonate / 12-deoxyaklanonic acid monooxygenase